MGKTRGIHSSDDIGDSGLSEYNIQDSLLHLIVSQTNQDEKLEASVHPQAHLETLTGPHRGPAIDLELLKDNPRICIACGVDFKSRANLHAHLIRHRHILGSLETFTRLPKYECRTCDGVINCSSMLKHKCYSKAQMDIRNRIKVLDRDGSPLVCILCRGRLLPSRVHLIIHIIVAHSIHRDPYKCVFCQAEFHSENLMMQEVHAFDCHAPELFMITRKACFKMVRNQLGNVVDATIPFTCFYDATKLESADLSALFEPTIQPGSAAEPSAPPVFKRHVCTESFMTLDEYTTHLCCIHGAVSPEGALTLGNEDPIEEVKRAKTQVSRVPGPTVRELLKNQTSAHYNPKKAKDDDINIPLKKDSVEEAQRKSASPRKLYYNKERVAPSLRARRWLIKMRSTKRMYAGEAKSQKPKEICRVCLEILPDEQRLNHHIGTYHYPESKKRLKHLADKDKLSGILDIDLLCTECYIMYPDSLSLQVHMMVSHASKDWRHCGLCGYEFFADNGGTPTHLRLVKFSSNEGESEHPTLPGNPLLTGDASSIDAWPLPAELMWRMIKTHETVHRERLFPPRQVPYLPLVLIDQLIGSRAIQAGMAGNWLIKRSAEEVQGIQATDDQIGGLAGPTTAMEAFMSAAPRPRATSVDLIMVNEARDNLTKLIRENEEMLPAEEQPDVARPSMAISYDKSADMPKLPAWLVHKFTELGEVNAARQVELDFAENL
ncbi:unnamed protein product [Calicophoron daubneyi]|uniref:C2H2-type domain-containing protein n=1 Tax=Calicophoron daubneyi TaxID=300641 RepID=A0AAV2TVE5_CALDB